ncbi:acid-sensing ion channel 4-A-like [Hydractinia symbiolongicarpus]|uniref:acid-sensing ion channel 4-A-like n=1 Tax=Hydractinia symbiolongicarpus TaxID=13093 RepID=UPI00254C266E|nr:acid-sensing ion channel 4-A-like [Hydractinia symbiolongicarpus]
MNQQNTNETYTKKKKKRFSKQFNQFAQNTTAHGFLHVVMSENRSIKVFWICVITACFAVAAYQGHQLITQYREKPLATKIWVEKEAVQTFPLVAICNQNPILKDKFSDLLNTTAFRQQRSTIKELLNKALSSHKLKYYLFAHLFQGMSMIAAQNGSAVFRYGNTFNDTILSCTYSQVYNCENLKQWRQFWHYKYGNCFAFNTGFDQDGNEIEPIKTKPGFDNGLYLTISINRKQYIPGIADAIGALLFIGSQEHSVDMYHGSIFFQPGMEHYVAFQKKKRIRIDPFNNNSCIKNYTEYFSSLSAQIKITKYSTKICRDYCYDNNFINACNCTSDDLRKQNYRLCDNTDFSCLLNVAIGLKSVDNQCLAQCKFPCEETYYTVLTSSGLFFHNKDDDEADERLNIYIYSKSTEVEVTEDKLLYHWENLLADFGGHLGLWGGFSVLTIMEIIAFAIAVLWNCTKVVFKKIN